MIAKVKPWKETRTSRICEMLRKGIARKIVAKKIGCSVNVVRNVAEEYRIAKDGGEMREDPATMLGQFALAGKRFGGDMAVVATEIGRLFDTVEEGKSTPPKEEMQETAEALAVPLARIEMFWQRDWGPLYRQMVGRRESVDRQMVGNFKEHVDAIPDLTFEELAWIDVGEDEEAEPVAVNRIYRDITPAIRELCPRDPVDPRKAAIRFAIRVFNCVDVGNSGKAVFTEST